MKKLFAGLFLMMLALQLQAQTVEEVLGKYVEAAGGREKLEAIRYLEVLGNVKMGVMGQNIELPLTLVREKGKLFRRQVGGVMGMGDSFTMVTDTSGVIYVPAMRGFGGRGGGGFDGMPQGNEPTITRMQPAEVTAQQYELDCAGAFGELVNYAAKGHTAELQGTEKVNKLPCYKVKMTLKTGQTVTYFIDVQTSLVKKVEATGDMALNLTGFGPMMKAFGSRIGKDTKATLLVKEYKDFKGIQYPVKTLLSFGPVETEVENLTVNINEGLEEKWYHVK
ncbi:MAG: hypothetical protein EPO58_18765 [Chitinophagaceae bacterium]|nr:MAG: hypothetical protein EPO58_18765 [Chitinophagaceae bacterium]